MKARIIWEKLRSSYWFLPTVMSVIAIGLSFGCLRLDATIARKVLEEQGWIYSGGPQGARGVLATIAGSIITVAGTTFSVTIAVLSMAAAQFGPRLLRNFMRDRANQTVLGVFMATFLYCLLVLRAVRGANDDTYVPHLSVTVGVVLAIVSLAALIFFIHHVAESIQISNMIASVGRELDDAICRLFPRSGDDVEAEPKPRPQERHVTVIFAERTGYIQDIDLDALLEMATLSKGILRLRMRPGDYLISGMQLAEAEMPEEIAAADAEAVRSAFITGQKRTPDQDAEFAFLQIVELAVRALSPGINDPFTAVMCIDRISGALCLLADRSLPSGCRFDRERQLRLKARSYSYEELVKAAFSQIRENGMSHSNVLNRLRMQIDTVLSRTQNPEFRAALEAEKSQLPPPGRRC